MTIRPRYADLFEALCDPDPDRADRAFDAILFDRGEALPDLKECYQQATRNAKLRYLIVQLMGFSGDPRAVAMVAPALQDHHPVVRAEACRALEDLGAKTQREALQAMLDDEDPVVRIAAKEALESLPSR
ncbi:MAG: HEAT repeat domain-containing protein [Myxococcota bacterium]